jgi:MFS family permease
VIARLVQGGGAAMMFPQAMTGIQLHFTGPGRIRAFGAFAVALSAGAVLGQVFGGVLVAAAGWRSIFLVNVPIVVLAIGAGLRRLPADSPLGSRRIDLPGVLTLVASMALMLVPLTLGAQQGWPPWTWISLAASAIAAAGFAAVERQAVRVGGAPLISMRILAPRVVWAGLATLTATAATYFALLFTVAVYFQFGLGHTAPASAMTLVPWVAAHGTGGGRSLMLNAHVEVVPPGDALAWPQPGAFAGQADAEYVYGRGSCDMKGGLVAAIWAIRALAEAGVRLPGDLILACVQGEEDGGLGTFATLARGWRADGCVIPESTSLDLVPACAGSLTFRLRVPGLAVHASRRTAGVSPVEKFWPVFQALRDPEARAATPTRIR